MGRPYTAVTHITASAGAESNHTVFTVPSGRRFKLKTLLVLFPAGTYGELEISIYKGSQKMVPDQGVITGDNVLVALETERAWDGGQDVVAHYKNTNTTEARECYLYLIGEMI